MTPLLVDGGVLVFFFSSSALNDRLCKCLRAFYEDVHLYSHPPTERDGYAWVPVNIVIGRKRRHEVPPGSSVWLDEEELPAAGTEPCWPVPGGREPFRWEMGGYTDEQLSDLADRSHLWQRTRSGPIEIGRPILPLKLGHIPMVLASGRLNGMIHDHLARARIDKNWKTIDRKVDEEGDVVALVQRQHVHLSIKCLAKREGRVTIHSFGQQPQEDSKAGTS